MVVGHFEFAPIAMSESIQKAKALLEKMGTIKDGAEFVRHFEADGCTVDLRQLSSYLSSKSGKKHFKHNKQAGHWELVNPAQLNLTDKREESAS